MMDLVLVHQALHFGNIIVRFNEVGKRGHDGSDIRNFFVFLHSSGSLRHGQSGLLVRGSSIWFMDPSLETSCRTNHELCIMLSAELITSGSWVPIIRIGSMDTVANFQSSFPTLVDTKTKISSIS